MQHISLEKGNLLEAIAYKKVIYVKNHKMAYFISPGCRPKSEASINEVQIPTLTEYVRILRNKSINSLDAQKSFRESIIIDNNKFYRVNLGNLKSFNNKSSHYFLLESLDNLSFKHSYLSNTKKISILEKHYETFEEILDKINVGRKSDNLFDYKRKIHKEFVYKNSAKYFFYLPHLNIEIEDSDIGDYSKRFINEMFFKRYPYLDYKTKNTKAHKLQSDFEGYDKYLIEANVGLTLRDKIKKIKTSLISII